jgi:alanine racemase
MEMFRRTFAEINLDHLAHNISVLQKAFPSTFISPMVKANAYGHGDVQLALFMERRGIKSFGVCLLEEGLLLRKHGVKAEVLVFRGFDRLGAEKIVEYGLTPIVTSFEQLDYLEAAATSAAVSVHLKFDTGMNRLGFDPKDGQKLYDRLWQNKKLRLKAIASHLYNGEDAVDPNGKTGGQLRKLHSLAQLFKPFDIFCHALNSSGSLSRLQLKQEGVTDPNHPLLLQDWGMRPGLMIYGYNTLANQAVADLKPVMSLKAQVISLRTIQAGEIVSYGGTWTAPRETIIAVAAIGYADGYHRILSNQTSVLFMGKRVPVVGTVCMDYIMLDVTEVAKGRTLESFNEEDVVLFGEDEKGHNLSADELALKAKTISYEMLTSVGVRVPRVYVGEDLDGLFEGLKV